MIEKQSIKEKDVWIKVDPFHVQRENPNIIPTEYFTATFYLQEPVSDNNGEIIKDDEGTTKLFESPVAALSYARRRVESMI